MIPVLVAAGLCCPAAHAADRPCSPGELPEQQINERAAAAFQGLELALSRIVAERDYTAVIDPGPGSTAATEPTTVALVSLGAAPLAHPVSATLSGGSATVPVTLEAGERAAVQLAITEDGPNGPCRQTYASGPIEAFAPTVTADRARIEGSPGDTSLAVVDVILDRSLCDARIVATASAGGRSARVTTRARCQGADLARAPGGLLIGLAPRKSTTVASFEVGGHHVADHVVRYSIAYAGHRLAHGSFRARTRLVHHGRLSFYKTTIDRLHRA